MDEIDYYSSALPCLTGYNWVLNNPNVFTDPDGNFTTSIYNSSTTIDVSGGSFNNGFTNVSFAAAAYSVGYYDFSGKASGEYRRRASDVETGRIFNYKGDPNNVKILYDEYWEEVPGGPLFSQALPNVRFRRVGNSGAMIALDAASYTLTGADLYNNFIHNHRTYTTTKGLVKNIYRADGTVRSARAAQFARASRYVRSAGVAGTVLMTGVAGANIGTSIYNNQPIRPLDAADLTVGAVGLTTAGLVTAGIVSNPVGWVVGAGVAVYSAGRIIYDLTQE